jgi:hypothetical protein
MSWKRGRIAPLATLLVAVGAMSVAATPASAGALENWVVSGSLTAKKLNQTITLPEGSTFNGGFTLETEVGPATEPIIARGTLTGAVFVPPFKATLNLLGVPTTVGVTFTPVGEADGTIVSAPLAACGTKFSCLTLTVPTEANIGITSAGLFGTTVPTKCKTEEPVLFKLTTKLTLEQLTRSGSHFAGTVTIPSIECDGISGLVVGPALTALMSGPENPYTLAITPPPPA